MLRFRIDGDDFSASFKELRGLRLSGPDRAKYRPSGTLP
jgi:hypothetical protein